MSRRIVYRIIWIPSLIAIIALFVTYGMGEVRPAPKPEKLAPQSTKDGQLAVSVPGNWPVKIASVKGLESYIRCTPGTDAKFQVSLDYLSAALAATDDAAVPPPQIGNPLAPVNEAAILKAKLQHAHEREGEQLEAPNLDRLREYKEETAKEGTINGRPALFSHFTAVRTRGFRSTPVSGYRGTAMDGKRCILLLCYGPAEDEKTLTPTYKKMAASIQVTGGEQ